MIRLKSLVLESKVGNRLIEQGTATPTTVYEFSDSFPDNIVLPIKPNQPALTSFAAITKIDQLSISLQDFINTLNSAVSAGKLKTGTISIAAEAAGTTAATKSIPKGGWSQEQVDFSYSNGAKMNNQTLADRRAEAIETMIKKFVKLPAGVTITKTANGNGSKKSSKATVPILTYNVNTNTQIQKNGKTETVNPKAQKYVAPAYNDAKIELTKCGSPMKANGLCGDPIAYRTKLEPTSGDITLSFSSYYIPDRMVVVKVLNNTPTIIADTGYVSSNPQETQVEFGKLLDELNKTKPNGYNGQIKNSSEVASVPVKLDDPNATYFMEIYAPLGPTIWDASLACQVKREPAVLTVDTKLTWPSGTVHSMDTFFSQSNFRAAIASYIPTLKVGNQIQNIILSIAEGDLTKSNPKVTSEPADTFNSANKIPISSLTIFPPTEDNQFTARAFQWSANRPGLSVDDVIKKYR